MSLEEKHDSSSGEMRDNETNQLLELESHLCYQTSGVSQNLSCEYENLRKSANEMQGFSRGEMEEIEERSDNSQMETEELNINKKLTMLQDVFKTVGSDLEDIKTLMLRLREILSNGCDRKSHLDLNHQRDCSTGESSKEIIVIDDEDNDEDEPKQNLPPLQQEANLEAGPTREGSTDSFDDSKYSTLVADIEVLKNKLVSLKRNLAK